jgi:phosphopantetheinyl transferase
MPLVETVHTNEIYLQIWNISENEAFFIGENAAIDRSQLSLYRHPQARLQWLASRMLLYLYLGKEQYSNLAKNERGKMMLKESDLKVSISHSENLVAVAFSTFQFGIDIQKFNEKIPRLAAKFIPEQDLNLIKNDSNFDQISHVHWGIKEALFKADEEGSLDYRKNLLLHWNHQYKVDGDSFKSSIQKNELTTCFDSHYREISTDFLLCSVTKS